MRKRGRFPGEATQPSRLLTRHRAPARHRGRTPPGTPGSGPRGRKPPRRPQPHPPHPRLEWRSESGEDMTGASGGESRGQGPSAANARIQASSDVQRGLAPAPPHHAPGPGSLSRRRRRPLGRWSRRGRPARPAPPPPPPLSAAASTSSAPPPPGLFPRGRRHLLAAQARAPRAPRGRQPPLPSAISRLGPGPGGEGGETEREGRGRPSFRGRKCGE